MTEELELESLQPLDDDVDPAEALVGKTLGKRYLVQRLLGTGGMGAVYLAQHVAMRKPVAIKVLHPEMTAMEEMIARFEREAVASARINHPNVVNATDFGKLEDGSFYLVLAYVDGTSLTDLLERDGSLEPERACFIALQIAEALAAAHDAGVVHRDLKPDNCMVVEGPERTDVVKVLDFGIAKIQSTGSGDTRKLTRAGSIFGTPDYMSPEQAAGKQVDERCDLYALGIILYEMLSGKVPFDAEEIMVVLTLHLTQPPAPLPGSIDPRLSALVMKLLEKEPDNRPQTASEVASELRGFIVSHRYNSQAPPPFSQPRASQIALQAVSSIGAAASLGLERTRVMAGRRVPLWQALVGVVALLGIAWWALRDDGLDLAPETSSPRSLVTTSSNPPPLPLDRAARGDSAALATLEKSPETSRTADVWLAIARGKSVTGQDMQALQAYDAALRKEPKLATDVQLRADLREAAADETNYKMAQTMALEHLSDAGPDLLFDVWTSAKKETKASAYAKRQLAQPDVLKKASAGLQVAMAVREAKGCQAYLELLPRIRKFGDDRCLSRVQRLLSREGCGFFGLDDCYGCLRKGSLLTTTIAAIKDRPAPKF